MISTTSHPAVTKGEHACLIYDDPRDQLPTLLPFIREGLEQGEQCIYVVDDFSIDALLESLSAYGIDVRAASEHGALCLWTRDEWRQPGELDSAVKSDQVRSILKSARAAGFAGVRLAVEMTWTLQPDIPIDRVRHWEATLDTIGDPDIPVSIVCQYSRSRLAPAALEAGLNTHRLAVIGAQRHRNHYFKGPEILSGADGHATVAARSDRVERMLSQLQRTRRMEERERARQQQADSPHAAALYGFTPNYARADSSELLWGIPRRPEALSLVSHELRTPVATILGNAQLLARLADALPIEERVISVTTIVDEALRLGHVLDDLFVLAHVQGRDELLLEPVVLRHLLERQIEAHQRRHPARRINLVTELYEPAVVADPSYVAQIIDNLLDNAERYAPPATPILVATAFQEQFMAVRVIDQGPSAPTDKQEDLFRPFPSSALGARTGHGASLAASKRLVEAHAGRIWTAAHHDGGAEFGFTLPVAIEGDEHGQ